MRVLFSNDYDMAAVWQEVARGDSPSHHLWGAWQLRTLGMDVDVLPFAVHPTVQRLTERRVGDLDQQWRMLSRRGDVGDVVYSATQYNTMLVSMLRSARLFRTPLVALVHHPLRGVLRRPEVFRTVFGGHDLLLCLTDDVRRHLRDDVGVPDDRLALVGWGVDLLFYDRVRPTSAGVRPAIDRPVVIAAGKTKRDYATLVAAARGVDADVRIFCSAHSAPETGGDAPNVTVHYDRDDPGQAVALSHRDLLAEYAVATAVAVPLAETGSSTGLTSLLEAMAMEKPVVMTRNPSVGLDIEAEGVGLWVDRGDVDGWRRAMQRLVGDPDEAAAMGRRGRHLCEQRYDIDDFAARLADALVTATRDRRSGRARRLAR